MSGAMGRSNIQTVTVKDLNRAPVVNPNLNVWLSVYVSKSTSPAELKLMTNYAKPQELSKAQYLNAETNAVIATVLAGASDTLFSKWLPYTDGTYKIKIIPYDLNGAIGTSNTQTVTVKSDLSTN